MSHFNPSQLSSSLPFQRPVSPSPLGAWDVTSAYVLCQRPCLLHPLPPSRSTTYIPRSFHGTVTRPHLTAGTSKVCLLFSYLIATSLWRGSQPPRILCLKKEFHSLWNLGGLELIQTRLASNSELPASTSRVLGVCHTWLGKETVEGYPEVTLSKSTPIQ